VNDTQQGKGVIMFMGAPGSGKGTQARFVQERLGFERIETGAILRSMRNETTEVAKMVIKMIDAGDLAPPPLVAELVIGKTKEILARGNGVVFDGSPRTLYEVEELLNELGKDHVGKIMAICLDVPIIDARERLLIRLVCGKCNTPATNSKKNCERCGAELTKRKDDDPEAMENRWNEFKYRTQPVVNYLDSLGLSEHIDGARPIEQVAEDVEKVIRKRLGL
jgi:adenylate kinase